MEEPKYKVSITKSAAKTADKMPSLERDRFLSLIRDLRECGSILPEWKSTPLKGMPGKYHCHLSYKWVACWKNENGSILIEVYYVGSREKAPY
jgi:hypothetical protein